MEQLLKQTDVYRVSDEVEAIELIERFRNNQAAEGYTLTKGSYVLKTKKNKGEVVDSWAVATVERTYND